LKKGSPTWKRKGVHRASEELTCTRNLRGGVRKPLDSAKKDTSCQGGYGGAERRRTPAEKGVVQLKSGVSLRAAYQE